MNEVSESSALAIHIWLGKLMVRACFSETITTNCESFISVEEEVGETLEREILKLPAPELDERDMVKEPERFSSIPAACIIPVTEVEPPPPPGKPELPPIPPIPDPLLLVPVGVAVFESVRLAMVPE